MRGGVCALAFGLAFFLAGLARAAALDVAVEAAAGADALPDAVRQVVDQAVRAVTRLADDQDGGEVNRLRRRARDAAQSALATQGYFTPRVSLRQDTNAEGAPLWRISVDPGPRALVESVDLRFTGRAARSEYAERVAAWRAAWPLTPGRIFINADWNKAKAELLQSVSDRDFLMARITASSAEVDPQTARVRLSVSIDSGPRVRMGPVQTRGLQRVPDTLIDSYLRYSPGESYDQDRLDQWQQDLQSTAFFRGAFVSMGAQGAASASAEAAQAALDAGVAAPADPPPADSDGEVTLPVDVRVVEAPPRRAAVSVGVDDTAGARLESTYRQNVVLGYPVTLETGAGADRLRQRAYLDILLPPDERGRRDSYGVLAEHSDIEGLDVTRFALGATRLQTRKGAGDSRVEYETRWGGLLAHDHVRIAGGETYDLPTATITAEWLRRDVDSKYDPREGNLIALGGGVGAALDTGEPYARARLRAQRWWPVGPRDVFTLRGEVGKVWADRRTRIPDDFGFRTGGARTIRGYRYLSLGLRQNNAIVGAPAMAVASAEYDHYFNERWGVGLFVDAGDAAESFGRMDLAVGYGAGVRVRTPAGPLFLDVAYGQRERDLRVHFSLGIAF